MKIACVTPDKKRDYTCENVLEGLHRLGHELVISDPGNGFCDRAMNDGDFLREANTSDLLLVFFGKVRGNRPPRRYFIEDVNLPKQRKIYVDGSEWRMDGWDNVQQVAQSLEDASKRRGEPWLDREMMQSCSAYYKRECYPEDVLYGIKPLPFGLAARHIQNIDDMQKDIDVFCSFGHVKTGLRDDVTKICERLAKERDDLKFSFESKLNQEDYKERLRGSKIVIDAFGGGDTTDRFWEAVGASCCVLYQRHNVMFPHSFDEWKHAVSYTDKVSFETQLSTT